MKSLFSFLARRFMPVLSLITDSEGTGTWSSVLRFKNVLNVLNEEISNYSALFAPYFYQNVNKIFLGW